MALILLMLCTVLSPTRPLYSPPHLAGGRQGGSRYSPPPPGEGRVGAALAKASTSASTPSTPPTIGRAPPTPAFKWMAVRPTFPAATSPASPSVAARAPRRSPRA